MYLERIHLEIIRHQQGSDGSCEFFNSVRTESQALLITGLRMVILHCVYRIASCAIKVRSYRVLRADTFGDYSAGGAAGQYDGGCDRFRI